VIAFARQAVVELALVHVRESKADAAEITDVIRTRFVDAEIVNFPGASLYRQRHGFAQLSGSGGHRLEHDRAQFTGQRAALRRDVADIVARTLAENPREKARPEASAPVVQNVTIVGGNN